MGSYFFRRTMKQPTNWSNNPSAEVNRVIYNSPTVQYDSATTTFDSVIPSNMSDKGKTPLDWNKTTKTATDWNKTTKVPTEWTNS